MALTAHSLIVAAQGPRQRTFATPEDAVRALTEAIKAGNLDELLAIFGPEGQELIASSDAATARTESRGLHGRRRRRVAPAGSGDQPQGAHRRQRGMAVPGPSREEREQLAIRLPPRERKKCSRAGSVATSWR